MTNAVKNRVVTPERKATPLVINGDMNIAQRSTEVTGLGDGDEGYVTVDRFRHSVGAGAGRFTSKQTAVDDLDGFQNCLELDCTTADTSIAAGEFLTIDYRLEGQDLQAFKKGETNAEYYTLAFYAKADAAVTYGIELRDHDNGRHITSTFTTGTDWTHHVISFPGDTTGNFSDDNGESLRIRLWLHAGSTYNGGTAPTSWASQSNANSVSSSNGSFFASTDRSLKITGFQLEVGDYNASTLPPFQYESFGKNLARCQRYYQHSFPYGTAPQNYSSYTAGQSDNSIGATMSSTEFKTVIPFKCEMRAAPTITYYRAQNTPEDSEWTFYDGADKLNPASMASNSQTHRFTAVLTYSSGLTAGNSGLCQGNYKADAEL